MATCLIWVVPDKRAPGSALALSGASADPGPISRGGGHFGEVVDGFFKTTSVGGYGFLRSQERHYTGSAIEYFTWLNAKLDSIEAMPSRRVSLFFKKAS